VGPEAEDALSLAPGSRLGPYDGVTRLYATAVSADGKTVLFNTRRDLSSLFLVEGLE